MSNNARQNCKKGLCYNEAGNHIEVMLGVWEGMTVTDPMLAHMTGWERAEYKIFNGGNRKMRFEANSE